MNRKITGILLAVLLATVGTFALVAYVQSAKDEAVAGERQVEVVVVRDRIRKGATVEEIRGAVDTSKVPAKVQPDDAVTDLTALDDGLVAAVDLEPGEVLLRSRLVDAADLARASVPEGMQEVTVALEPERAVGGSLSAGDTVGVVLSFDPFERDEAQGGGKTPNMSHLTFHKVVVTSVQFDQNESSPTLAGEGEEEEENVERAPSNRLLVTLALKSPQVEQVVFAAEFGHIWLTSEPAHADESGTRIVTLGEAYAPTPLPGAQP